MNAFLFYIQPPSVATLSLLLFLEDEHELENIFHVGSRSLNIKL